MALNSTRIGLSVAAFPDVCKTPSAPAPVPIPYPNIGSARSGSRSVTTRTRAAGDAAAESKQASAQRLRATLHSLHSQLSTLPGADPNRWHELLDKYVITSAELYKALASD